MRKILVILGGLLLFSGIGQADTVSYLVTGSTTFTGNDVCSGVPCTETIAFSFDFNWVFDSTDGNDVYLAETSNFLAVGSGDLGSFVDSYPQEGRIDCCKPFIDVPGNSGDDFNIDTQLQSSDEPVLPLFSVVIWNCITQVCVTDFYPPGKGSGEYDGDVVGNTIYTVSLVPEPSSLLLLPLGLAAIQIVGRRSRLQYAQSG